MNEQQWNIGGIMSTGGNQGTRIKVKLREDFSRHVTSSCTTRQISYL